MSEIAPDEILTPAFLRSKRTQHRCTLATRQAFVPHGQSTNHITDANETRSYALVFYVLKDMPMNCLTVDDYEPNAREVYLTVDHGFCLRTGRAELVKPMKREQVFVKGNTRMEYLLSPGEDPSKNGTNEDTRRLIAQRYWFNFYANREAIHKAAQVAYNTKAKKPLDSDVPFSVEDSLVRWDPMDEAVRLGVGDNAELYKRIQQVLAKSKATSAETKGSVAQHKDVLNLPMYSFIKHTRIDQFYATPFLRYLRISDTVSSNINHVPPGRIYDPREFANVAANAFPVDDMFKDPKCAVGARRLFGHTTAFAYHSVDNETLAETVCLEQVNPDEYGFPDATANDDSSEDELVAAASPNAAALRALPVYQRKITDLQKRHRHELDDVTMPTRFPYPKLVYDLHDHVMCPEVISMIHFPIPMGSLVTPHMLAHGFAVVQMSELRIQLAAIARLERIEADQSHGLVHYQYEDLVNEADALADENGGLNERAKRIMTEQQDVVQAAIRELNGLAHGRDHPLLFHAAYGRYKASTHKVMHMDDFLWVNNNSSNAYRSGGPTSSEEESILYVRERMRHTIRKEIRAAANLDTTMLDTFGRVRALSGATLDTIRAEQKLRDEEANLSKWSKDYANSLIDNVDPQFREQDDFLAQRTDNQCNIVLNRVRADEKFTKLEDNIERAKAQEAFHTQTYNHYRQAFQRVINTLRESDNIPETLASPEFKCFYNRACTPEGIKRLLGDAPQYDYDATPFTVCLQQLVDIMTDVHKTSPNTLTPALLVFFCALDGFTYYFGRSNSALNVLVAAATGVGKSFMGMLMQILFPPGVVMPLTNVTKNSFNGHVSYDALVMVFNEIMSSWVGGGGNSKEAREAGSSETVLFLKDRSTRFQSDVKRTVKDPKTGETRIESTKASHHNVVIGFTNNDMVFLEQAVRRRFVVLFVPKPMRIPSVDPDSVSDFYGKAAAHKLFYERIRVVVAQYITLSCALKAEAVPQPSTTSLSTWIRLINEKGKAHGFPKLLDGANLHYVIQLTLKVQQYYASWYSVLSPDAHYFHQMPGAPERWSADASLQLGAANLAPTKEALVYTMGLLENVIMPVYVTRLLRDILLEGLQIGKGRLRVRRIDVPEHGNVVPKFDFNYLTLTDRNYEALMKTISKLSKDYELRVQEIGLFLKELADERIPMKRKISGFIQDDDDDKPFVRNLTSVKYAKSEALSTIAPVILEADETNGRKKAYRLCLSIEFLQKTFKIKICDNEDFAGMAAKLAITTVQQKTYAECTNTYLAEHMTLKKEHSVLMTIVREALESDVLVKHPAERKNAPVPPALTRYLTPLHAEPIIMGSATTDRTVMVMFHATGRQLPLNRTDKPMPKLVLMDFGQPTSERPTKRARESEYAKDARGELLRNASTIQATLCDPDYTAAKEMHLSMCLPVSPLVKEAYGEKLAMRPGLVLPIGFMPIAYFVSRWISRQTKTEEKFMAYPLENVRYKIDNANKRLVGADTNEISSDHVDIELMSGRATIGGMTFSVPGVSRTAWEAYRQEMDEVAQELDDDAYDWFYTQAPPAGDGGANGGAAQRARPARSLRRVVDEDSMDIS